MVAVSDAVEARSPLAGISSGRNRRRIPRLAKSDGDFFPEWLREIAVELIRPVPPLDQVLEQVKTAEVKAMMGQINIQRITPGTTEVRNIRRSGVALNASTGELLYAYGFGWGGEFKDYQNFHGRKVARTVSHESPEVTAEVMTLEDLAPVFPISSIPPPRTEIHSRCRPN